MRKHNKELGIYLINLNTLQKFVEANRISAFRVYTVIKDKYSGSIHPKQYKEIAKLLQLKQVDKQIKQLQDMGVLRKRSHDWLTITKRVDFAPSNRNPSREVNIVGLSKIHELRKAEYLARMNVKNNPYGQCLNDPTPGSYQVSSSFAKNVGQVIYTERTLNKWLHILRRDGRVQVYNTQQTLFASDLQTCKSVKERMEDKKTFIRRTIFDPTEPNYSIQYPFRIVKCLPNMIKFCKV
jgi:hypothetical protein